MMRRLFLQTFALASCLLVFLAPATALAAFNPLENSCYAAGTDEATACQDSTGDPVTGENGLLIRATRVVAIIAGFTAVVIIVLAGIRYITSGGSSDQVSQAKKTIIYASIGIIVIVLGQAFISYIISRI